MPSLDACRLGKPRKWKAGAIGQPSSQPDREGTLVMITLFVVQLYGADFNKLLFAVITKTIRCIFMDVG